MIKSKEDIRSAKPEKFNGLYFKRWQNQMRFWLTTLGLYSAIDSSTSSNESPLIVELSDPSSSSNSEAPKTTTDIDYHCKHRILSALDDKLYDIYFEIPTAKALWDSLNSEYALDDAGIERLSSSAFNRFVMIDEKPINEQLHEFQDHIRYLQSKGTSFSEDFKVACLIDKLPPSWSEFARELRHNQGDQSLNQAITKVRIECEHRLKSLSLTPQNSCANLTENPNPSPFGFKKFKNKNFKKSKPNPKGFKPKFNHKTKMHRPNSQKKFCFVCGRTNHLAPSCFFKKKEPYKGPEKETAGFKPQVNMIEGNQPDGKFRNHVEEV